MSLYLKLFETTAAYDAAKDNLILPNVSVCEDAPTVVHYNPLSPTPSHDYVEIGGVKWATMNVGANSITDYGLYFQWGDTSGYTADQVTGSTTPHKAFEWADYKYSNGGSSASDMTKYTCSGSSGSGSGSGSDVEGDGFCELQPSDDAVTAAWGGNWRMPTQEEFAALGTATISTWEPNYEGRGVAGLVCTDKTDGSKKLFFPAAGFCSNGGVDNVGSDGYYWSSSLYSDVVLGYNLSFGSSNVYWQFDSYRHYGFSVRGVLAEN